MHLPHELVVLVTQYLGRRDLKSARLVSKLWCSCASESLFTTIHVSANKVDLDAFNAITSDPFLSKCVRRLVYDGTEFMPDLSKTEYFDRLLYQASSKFYRGQIQLSDCSDGEFCDLIIARVGRHRPDFEAAKQQVGDSNFITEGYKKYHEHAVYQQDSLRSGSFVNGLAQGLRKLSLLDTIHVPSRWPKPWQIDQGVGSLLARKWNPLHVYPQSWVRDRDPVSFACAEPNGIGHYFIIVSALVRAQRKIRNLAIFHYIPPEIFNRSDHSKPSVLSLDVVAFEGLEKLVLYLASWCHGSSHQVAPERCPNIDGLRMMLSSMTRLKTLDLYLPSNGFDEHAQVFPKDTIWTQLETISLFGLSAKATDLVDLLTFQMPKLQHLTIKLIALSDGIWEGVFECLKQYSKLSRFIINSFDCLDDYRPLYRSDGKTFDCQRHDHGHDHESLDEHEKEMHRRSLLGEITLYVVHGGRHPCLMPDQPDSAAEDFAKDLKPFLRCCGSSQSTWIADSP